MVDEIFGIVWACRQHSVALMLFSADVHSTDSSPLVWVCPEGHPEYLVGVWSASCWLGRVSPLCNDILTDCIFQGTIQLFCQLRTNHVGLNQVRGRRIL